MATVSIDFHTPPFVNKAQQRDAAPAVSTASIALPDTAQPLLFLTHGKFKLRGMYDCSRGFFRLLSEDSTAQPQ